MRKDGFYYHCLTRNIICRLPHLEELLICYILTSFMFLWYLEITMSYEVNIRTLLM